jgi:hypothetical protein
MNNTNTVTLETLEKKRNITKVILLGDLFYILSYAAIVVGLINLLYTDVDFFVTSLIVSIVLKFIYALTRLVSSKMKEHYGL